MKPVIHPGRLLRREMNARRLNSNRLDINLGVPSGSIASILDGRRSICADTALRLGRCLGNGHQFWLKLQGQYDVAAAAHEIPEEENKGRFLVDAT